MKRGREPTVLAAMLLALAFNAAVAVAHDTNPMGVTTGEHDHGHMVAGAMGSMSMPAHSSDMQSMGQHMVWTPVRPLTDADRRRAAELLKVIRASLEKYRDYHAALADGFLPYHPEFNEPTVHFTRQYNVVKARLKFDPASPTSLIYRRASGGKFELLGAMYTAPDDFTYDQLDARIPLSVARWHRHVNLCLPSHNEAWSKVDWSRFGNGSIVDPAACRAAGGFWASQLQGWMVHVNPWQKDAREVWGH